VTETERIRREWLRLAEAARVAAHCLSVPRNDMRCWAERFGRARSQAGEAAAAIGLPLPPPPTPDRSE
jgi:hypothetical protein